MTLDTTSNVKTYTGDGVTDSFSTVFVFFASSDIIVKVDDVTQIENTDYTVSGGNGAVGTVLFIAGAPASGDSIVFERSVAYEQQTDFTNFDGNPSDVTEKQFDLVVMQTQQLNDEVVRSLKSPAGSSNFDGEIPLTGNGGKFLQLKEDLTGFTLSSTIDTSDVTISTFGETLIANTDAATARQTLLMPSQSAFKRGALLVQNSDDDGYEQIDSQGSSGQILTSNGADALPSFQTLQRNLKLLETINASSDATIDFDSNIDSTYNTYMIVVNSLVPATDGNDLNLRVSRDGGSTYDSTGTPYRYHISRVNQSASAYNADVASGANQVLIGNSLGSASGEGYCCVMYIYNPSSSTQTTKFSINSSYITNSGNVIYGAGAFISQTVDSVDAIRLFMSTGNITSGTLQLYGVL